MPTGTIYYPLNELPKPREHQNLRNLTTVHSSQV